MTVRTCNKSVTSLGNVCAEKKYLTQIGARDATQ